MAQGVKVGAAPRFMRARQPFHMRPVRRDGERQVIAPFPGNGCQDSFFRIGDMQHSCSVSQLLEDFVNRNHWFDDRDSWHCDLSIWRRRPDTVGFAQSLHPLRPVINKGIRQESGGSACRTKERRHVLRFGSGNGLEWVLEHKAKSAKNQITAPRILAYSRYDADQRGRLSTPEQARAWVAEVAKKGADGLKLTSFRPDLMAAIIDEAKKQGLRTAAHLAQMGVARLNVLDAARLGLTTMEHWYGLPEALFAGRTVQDFPLDYNYNNEQHRFGQAGRLWQQAAPPFSPHWEKVMDELLKLDFTLDPTFTIYEASRDLMRARRAEWHETYTLPSLWRFYTPSRKAHGSYWFFWSTEDEVAWRNNYRLWMTFVNEYKNRGGRVTTGSDSGYIYKLYGFGYIRELELLREAGFHPLEVIRAATLKGAEALGLGDEIGTVEVGKLADFVVLTHDIMKTPANELYQVRVERTFVGGERVYVLPR